MNTMTWSMALAIALALAGASGQAQGKLPRSVAEQRAKAETNGHWPSFRLPPGNVRAEDYRALLGNTVVVSGVFGATGIARFALKVAFIGRDGRYLWCQPRKEGRYFLGDQHLVSGQNKTEIAFVADIRSRHQGRPGLVQPAL